MSPLTINLINRLLSQLNLVWKHDSLYWYCKLQFTTVDIEVTPDFDDVLTLLDLPVDIGSNIEYDSHQIATSRYFSWKVFKKNKHEIRPFLAHLKDFNYKSSIYTKTAINTVKALKKYIGYDIRGLQDMVVPETYDFKEIRCKFNGNLIKNWLKNETSNYDIGELMSGFRQYIGVDLHYNLDYYVYLTPPKRIRKDFLHYVSFVKFNYSNFEDLPFL
jgi:hypothetical protein